MALTPIEKYPQTSNPEVVLDPCICGGDNRRMHVQVVHQIKDGKKVKQLGCVFMGYASRKWTAQAFNDKGRKNLVTGKSTKADAVAYFEKMKF